MCERLDGATSAGPKTEDPESHLRGQMTTRATASSHIVCESSSRSQRQEDSRNESTWSRYHVSARPEASAHRRNRTPCSASAALARPGHRIRHACISAWRCNKKAARSHTAHLRPESLTESPCMQRGKHEQGVKPEQEAARRNSRATNIEQLHQWRCAVLYESLSGAPALRCVQCRATGATERATASVL